MALDPFSQPRSRRMHGSALSRLSVLVMSVHGGVDAVLLCDGMSCMGRNGAEVLVSTFVLGRGSLYCVETRQERESNTEHSLNSQSTHSLLRPSLSFGPYLAHDHVKETYKNQMQRKQRIISRQRKHNKCSCIVSLSHTRSRDVEV